MPHGSDWGEYTLEIDPNKTVYAFGIHLVKASGTIYLPIDNVRIYTDFEYTNYPVGTFYKTFTISSYSVSVFFSFSDDRKSVYLRFSNTDPNVTSYTYNLDTKRFTIETTGSIKVSFLTLTYGTITGTFDKANHKLTNLGLSGSIGGYLDGNGSLEIDQTAKYYDCDGTTSELQATFKRRYGGTVDTTNADRIESATFNRLSGTNSLKIRLWSGGLTQLNLQDDISLSCTDIGFWVYSSFTTEKTIRQWIFKGAGLSNNVEIGSVTALPGQWTYVRMGFTKATIRNFQLGLESYDPAQGYILFDDICLY